MPLPDFEYLRRVANRADPASILLERRFLDAQDLFFSVVEELGGAVDFDVADMHEVHAVAALMEHANGLRVLDVGCGSTEPYVLEDTFRDRYPPFFAEMLARLDARVTGVDIRPQAKSSYDHRVVDLVSPNWTASLEPPYDVIACFSLFNAPQSPFERNAALCDRLIDDLRRLLASDGVLIMNLRDELFGTDASNEEREERVRMYVETKGFALAHLDGNCAWLRRA